MNPTKSNAAEWVTTVARIGGPFAAWLIWNIPADLAGGLIPPAQTTAGISAWMAIWWMSEAVPLPVTALLPVVLFPLAGILPIDEATAPYANKYVLLLMGGFMLAQAVERWNLHRRIALLTVLAVGTQPKRLIGGFMLATAMLSMWISNTASTVLMLPIGMSMVGTLNEHLGAKVLGLPEEESNRVRVNLATCLMLGIAYAASIGGLGTLVGTPTNLLLARFAQEQGNELGFAQWMWFATPVSLLFLCLTWLLLTHCIFPIRIKSIPGGRELIKSELQRMGPVSRAEWSVLAVFLMTAAAWVMRQPLTNWTWLTTRVPPVGQLNDTLIALIGAMSLFVIPVGGKPNTFALNWQTASKIPWGVLLLFGGGFCLAAGISSSGLADWIGAQVNGLSFLPTWAFVFLVAAIVIFQTELTSNTPTAAVFLPILFGIAQGLEVEPMLLLVPATIAASCAFMLPVATPPNAIVFGSGHIAIRDMIKAGVCLNLLAVALIPTWVLLFGAPGS